MSSTMCIPTNPAITTRQFLARLEAVTAAATRREHRGCGGQLLGEH